MFKKNQIYYRYQYESGVKKVIYINELVPKQHRVMNNDKKEYYIVHETELHTTEQLALDYAVAINYKRGWLQREYEKFPNEPIYIEQKRSSIESFPEMWI